MFISIQSPTEPPVWLLGELLLAPVYIDLIFRSPPPSSRRLRRTYACRSMRNHRLEAAVDGTSVTNLRIARHDDGFSTRTRWVPPQRVCMRTRSSTGSADQKSGRESPHKEMRELRHCISLSDLLVSLQIILDRIEFFQPVTDELVFTKTERAMAAVNNSREPSATRRVIGGVIGVAVAYPFTNQRSRSPAAMRCKRIGDTSFWSEFSPADHGARMPSPRLSKARASIDAISATGDFEQCSPREPAVVVTA